MAHFPGNIGGLCPFDKQPEPAVVGVRLLHGLMPEAANVSKHSLNFSNNPKAAYPMHRELITLVSQNPRLANKVDNFILNDKSIIFASKEAISPEHLDEAVQGLAQGAFLGLHQRHPIDSTKVPSAKAQLSEAYAQDRVYPAINGAWR